MKINFTSFTKSKHASFAGACLLLVLVFAIIVHISGFRPIESFTIQDSPLLKLDGKTVEISKYQYLGSWLPPGRNVRAVDDWRYWRDTVRLRFKETPGTFHIDSNTTKLTGSERRLLTPDAEPGVFEKVNWQGNPVSLFAFRALSSRKQVAVAEIDTSDHIALYINGKLAQEMSGADNVELGSKVLFPVDLEAGENFFVMGMISNGGHPCLRMSLVLDQSRDFQAAWNISWGFLNKQIYNRTGNSFETPAVRWDSHFDKMTVGAEVCDALTGKILIKKEALRNGNVVRDGGKVLGEGIYRISYRSNYSQQETASEYFLMGSPREAYNAVRDLLEGLSWSSTEQLNIEAQLRRSEILLSQSNYDPQNAQWREKVLHALGRLAEFVHLKTQKGGDVFKDLPGVQFRGFISKIDNSKQFYRLYVPVSYTAQKPLPLILVLPTTIVSKERPFLESPNVAHHRQATELSKFAEKRGYGILWPGYRNATVGWSYESVRAEEALEDVEKNYNIDAARISLYGICAGGYYAGRLATIYPNRFAAIVYDRAIFDRHTGTSGGQSDSMNDWIRATNPSDKVVANPNLKIFVLHDGTKIVGHGEIELTNQFLASALPKRADIKYILGQRRIGASLWDLIFDFLADCKNAHPDRIKADVSGDSGYAGPISEVFATPYIVVEGTHVNKEEANFMDIAIKNLQAQHQAQFYDSEFVLKKDTDITDEDIGKYSLVLVGNAESNAVWGRLAAKYADSLTPYDAPDDWSSLPTESAFAEVFKNPANKKNYLLLIGSNKLGNLGLLKDFNPFKTWFDCYVFKYRDGHEREYIHAHRP